MTWVLLYLLLWLVFRMLLTLGRPLPPINEKYDMQHNRWEP